MIGILLVVLGTFLKVRRKRIIEKQTAHLKRASAIWDFADSTSGNNAIDQANEKAASERGGSGPAPFDARRAHSRQESHDSEVSMDAASVHSHPPPPASMASNNPYNRNMAPVRPAPPPMLPYMHPMQRVVNRLSSIAFSGMARSAPAPPLPPHDVEYGQQAPMRPALGREDSFGARAHQPPRNMFFPPPLPQQDMQATRPLAMPGSSI